MLSRPPVSGPTRHRLRRVLRSTARLRFAAAALACSGDGSGLHVEAQAVPNRPPRPSSMAAAALPTLETRIGAIKTALNADRCDGRFAPIVFRVPPRMRARGPIGPLQTQLLTVVSADWSSARAELRRYSRAPGQAWRAQGAALPVVLGHAGYGWGDGLHGEGAAVGRSGPIKREGDGRSPAGAFELAGAYGYAETLGLRLPYRRVDDSERCVDDPASKHYNEVLSNRDGPPDWRSSEAMLRDDDLYELAIQIAHNRNPVRSGHGSCIFLHVWAGPDAPVTGCTALDKRALFEVARWLQPNAAVLVALPKSEYSALRVPWGLP